MSGGCLFPRACSCLIRDSALSKYSSKVSTWVRLEEDSVQDRLEVGAVKSPRVSSTLLSSENGDALGLKDTHNQLRKIGRGEDQAELIDEALKMSKKSRARGLPPGLRTRRRYSGICWQMARIFSATIRRGE